MISSERYSAGNTLSKISKDGSELVSLTGLESSEMGEVVDQNEEGMSDNTTDEVSNYQNCPPWEISNQIADSNLKGD